MKLSVIIPVYNAEKYIARCLESVSAAREPEMEIIVVDDGSSDRSLEECRRISRKDSRIQVLSKQNEGVSVARNTGMQAARGEYLMFLDADDYMKASEWENILSEMERRFDFYAFSYDSLYQDGSSRKEPFPPGCEGDSLENAYQILLSTPLFHTCWGKLFRRELIIRHQLQFVPGMKIGEDYLFVLEYFRYVRTVCIKNISIMYYRQNEAGAMGSFQFQSRLDNIVTVWNYCRKYVKQEKFRPYEMDMKEYQFSAFAYFVRMMVHAYPVRESARLLRVTLENQNIRNLLENVPAGRLGGNKKVEYLMLSGKLCMPAVLYYKLKQRIMAHKN